MYVQLQLSARNVAELQQHQDFTDTAIRKSNTESAQSNSSGSTTSPASQTSSPAPGSSVSTPTDNSDSQTRRTSFKSTPPTLHLSPAVGCHHHPSPLGSCPPLSTHTLPGVSAPSFPSGCPHASSPQPAATPVSSPASTASIPGPQSPSPASTFKEVSFIYTPALVTVHKLTQD